MAQRNTKRQGKGDLIFVTGAGGAIGRIVARTLLDRGYRVRGFGLGEQYYREPNFFHELERLGDFQFEIGSILDQHSLVRAMSGAKKVIHLAAMTGGRRTQEDRLRCFDINVNGTQKVMAACVANGVEHVVNLSSSAVYGVPVRNPVTEAETLKPQSAYALSKAAAEEVVAAFAQAFPSLHYTTLRLFNAYGEHCASMLALDAFVLRAAQGQPPVVNGDGSQQRCYTHAEDIADAIIRILKTPEARNRTYNLGNPDAVISIRDLAELVIEVIAPAGNLVVEYKDAGAASANEVRAIWADIGRIEKDLGFRPRIGLREGLERIRDNLSGSTAA
jgi:nucleoside-diphosphate-sugar epimerase